MRKLLAIGLTLALLSGCADIDARQRAETVAALDQAFTTVQDAHVGFVPGETAPTDEPLQPLTEYQLQTLDKAAAQLDSVIKSASPDQQAIALRMIASIHRSVAAHGYQTAFAEAAMLMPRSNELLDMLQSVDHADARIHRFAPQDPSLLTNLKETQAATQGERTAVARDAAALQKRIDELQAQIDVLHAEYDKASEEKAKLLAEAFTAESEQRYNLQDQATAADRRAGIASTKMQELQEHVDVFRSELNVLKTRVRLHDEALEKLAEEISESEARRTQLASNREEAVAKKQQATERLVAELAELSAQWEQQVLSPMAAASIEMDKAVAAISEAVEKAERSSRPEFELDLVNLHVAKAHGLTMYVTALGNWGRLLDIVAQTAAADRAGSPLLANVKDGFATNAAEIRQQQQDLIAQARSAVSAGQDTARALASAGGPVAELADERLRQLESYNSRLEQARLK